MGALKLVGRILWFGGLALLFAGGWSANGRLRILRDWRKVNATVVESHLTRGRDNEGNVAYGTQIEFQYAVGGKNFQTFVSSSYWTTNYSEMKQQLDAFVPGTTHSILVSPADPNDVRFDAGYTPGFFVVAMVLAGMGAVFATIGGLFLLAARAVVPCVSCRRAINKAATACPFCGTPHVPEAPAP